MDPHKDALMGDGQCTTSDLTHGPESTTSCAEEKPSTSQDAPPLEDPASGQHLLGCSFSSLKRSLSSLRHRSPGSHCNDPTSKPDLSARALFHASTWPRPKAFKERTAEEIRVMRITQSVFSESVGPHRFEKQELKIFADLTASLNGFAVALLRSGIVIMLLNIVSLVWNRKAPWQGGDAALSWGSLSGVLATLFSAQNGAFIADRVLGFIMLRRVCATFQRLTFDRTGSHLPYVFTGMVQMRNFFRQIVIMKLTFSLVQILQAAALWPDIYVFVIRICLGLSLLRGLALSYMLADSAHNSGAEDAAFAVLLAAGKPEAGFDELPLLKRMAMVFVDGSAACHVFQRRHEASLGEEKAEGPKGKPQYEFSQTEERLLEGLMDMLRKMGVALSIHALSIALLGIATLQSGGLVDAYSSLFEVVDNAGRASLFFFAAGCFHKVITTQGSDIDNLLEGLGKKKGLTGLFYNLRDFMNGVTTGKILEVAFPMVMGLSISKKAIAFASATVLNYTPDRFQGLALQLKDMVMST